MGLARDAPPRPSVSFQTGRLLSLLSRPSVAGAPAAMMGAQGLQSNMPSVVLISWDHSVAPVGWSHSVAPVGWEHSVGSVRWPHSVAAGGLDRTGDRADSIFPIGKHIDLADTKTQRQWQDRGLIFSLRTFNSIYGPPMQPDGGIESGNTYGHRCCPVASGSRGRAGELRPKSQNPLAGPPGGQWGGRQAAGDGEDDDVYGGFSQAALDFPIHFKSWDSLALLTGRRRGRRGRGPGDRVFPKCLGGGHPPAQRAGVGDGRGAAADGDDVAGGEDDGRPADDRGGGVHTSARAIWSHVRVVCNPRWARPSPPQARGGGHRTHVFFPSHTPPFSMSGLTLVALSTLLIPTQDLCRSTCNPVCNDGVVLIYALQRGVALQQPCQRLPATQHRCTAGAEFVASVAAFAIEGRCAGAITHPHLHRRPRRRRHPSHVHVHMNLHRCLPRGWGRPPAGGRQACSDENPASLGITSRSSAELHGAPRSISNVPISPNRVRTFFREHSYSMECAFPERGDLRGAPRRSVEVRGASRSSAAELRRGALLKVPRGAPRSTFKIAAQRSSAETAATDCTERGHSGDRLYRTLVLRSSAELFQKSPAADRLRNSPAALRGPLSKAPRRGVPPWSSAELREVMLSRPEAGPDSRLGVHVVRVAFGIPEVISTSGPRRGGMQAPCPPAREPCQSVINNYVSCAYIDFHVIAHRCIDAQPQSAQQRGAADGTGFDPLKQGHMNMFSQTGPKKHSPVSVIFPEILRSGPSGGSFERTLVTGSGTSQNRSGEACSHDGTGALSRHPRRLPAKAWMRDASKPFPILV
eukprot:gene12415-biopygen7750